MINVKAILKNILIDLIEDKTIGLYHYGNENELKRVFASKNFNQKYPIVWLVMPFGSSKESLNQRQWNGRLRLLLVTSSKKEWLNDRRDIETFEKVLRPLYDAITRVFEKDLQIIVEDNAYDVLELPNYYQAETSEKNHILDYKDVIRLDFNALITDRGDCDVKRFIPKSEVLSLGVDTPLVIGNQVLVLK